MVMYHIRLSDPTLITQRYQHRNSRMQAVINEEVDRMLEDDVIERSHSARFCVDFGVLNAVTEKDTYPLPYIKAILDCLQQGSSLR